MLGEFKFQGDVGLAEPIALLLRSTPWAEPTLEASDWLVPIPLTRARSAERGFNQAQRLARALTTEKLQDGLLLRGGFTPD